MLECYLKKGELIEIDIKYVPDRIKSRRCYQFVVIDVASRWRYLQAYENASNLSAIKFLRKLVRVADFEIKAIKTDNDPCFTNRYMGYLRGADPSNPRFHVFPLLCKELKMEHCLIDSGKPQQNAFVERSH